MLTYTMHTIHLPVNIHSFLSYLSIVTFRRTIYPDISNYLLYKQYSVLYNKHTGNHGTYTHHPTTP